MLAVSRDDALALTLAKQLLEQVFADPPARVELVRQPGKDTLHRRGELCEGSLLSQLPVVAGYVSAVGAVTGRRVICHERLVSVDMERRDWETAKSGRGEDLIVALNVKRHDAAHGGSQLAQPLYVHAPILVKQARRVERVQHYDYLGAILPDEAGDPLSKRREFGVEWVQQPPILVSAAVVLVGFGDARTVQTSFVNLLHRVE